MIVASLTCVWSAGGIALTWEDVCYSFAPKRSLLGTQSQCHQPLPLFRLLLVSHLTIIGWCFPAACMKKPTPEEERAQKLILNHVSGAVLPGQLLAIMGASGAPKPIPSISLRK